MFWWFTISNTFVLIVSFSYRVLRYFIENVCVRNSFNSFVNIFSFVSNFSPKFVFYWFIFFLFWCASRLTNVRTFSKKMNLITYAFFFSKLFIFVVSVFTIVSIFFFCLTWFILSLTLKCSKIDMFEWWDNWRLDLIRVSIRSDCFEKFDLFIKDCMYDLLIITEVWRSFALRFEEFRYKNDLAVEWFDHVQINHFLSEILSLSYSFFYFDFCWRHF
jgi:hypothetical protein